MKDPLPRIVRSMFQFLPQLNNVSENIQVLFNTSYFRLDQEQPNQIIAMYCYWPNATSMKEVDFRGTIFDNFLYGKWVHMVSSNLMTDPVLISLTVVFENLILTALTAGFFFWKN